MPGSASHANVLNLPRTLGGSPDPDPTHSLACALATAADAGGGSWFLGWCLRGAPCPTSATSTPPSRPSSAAARISRIPVSFSLSPALAMLSLLLLAWGASTATPRRLLLASGVFSPWRSRTLSTDGSLGAPGRFRAPSQLLLSDPPRSSSSSSPLSASSTSLGISVSSSSITRSATSHSASNGSTAALLRRPSPICSLSSPFTLTAALRDLPASVLESLARASGSADSALALLGRRCLFSGDASARECAASSAAAASTGNLLP
mmetsp:Transcript_6693/g.12686  ORF Transcript_6693/g.12686 Transcript_6693/m.12686 type:complete len:264 (+) Transcript_6693:638-1429(+)